MKRNLLHRGRAVVLAIAVAAGTAGCTVNSPFQTAETQQITDGVPLDLQQAELRNLVLVSDLDGGQATLTGTVDNLTEKEITLEVTAGSDTVKQKVPPHELFRFSEDKPVTIKGLKAGAGDITSIRISAGGSDSSPVDVPVLPAEGYYKKYAPSDYTPVHNPQHTSDEKSH
ncbi:hypothetical protein [Janibacter corallicola]|uniref:hypothetical protein n=1 Tax=Janibacter corallicola TaxID=415212 RepID=UPI00082D2401|nr:hypothetical protein [Janibacter corallicola]